jgi:hypothetical protein
LEPGETRELDPLILNPATQVIAGRVVNEKGESVQGMSLILQGAESAFQQSTTDRDGRFRFEGLANEKVSLNTFDRGSDGLVVTAIEQAGDEHIQIITKPRDGRPH